MSDELLSSPPAPPSADDPDLFCPNCDYNLKGLAGGVCPECGNSYDRDRLIRWTTGRSVPLRFWCSQGDGMSPSIFLSSLFAPSKLGRGLPVFADPEEAGNYGMGIRVWAAIIAAVGGATLAEGIDMIAPLLLIPVYVIAGSLACEYFVARQIAHRVQPLAVPRNVRSRYRFWRTMCYCFSTHLLVASIAGSLVAVISSVSHFYPPMNLIPLVVGCVFVWWWICLTRAIAARGSPGLGRALTVVTIPLCVLLGSFVAGMVAIPVWLVVTMILGVGF